MDKARLKAALVLLLWAAFIHPALATIDRATVTGGTVAGTVHEGIASFKGIPFAAPPVGNFRWRAPQPVKAWTGIRQANDFALPCAQPAEEQQPQSREDCLYLNVWTAAQSSKEKRPVMVWIYGGGFAGGATSYPIYDGTHFATEGVVLVSIAYRVGPFGFLAHPELSRESGKASGAYGLQDQIAALQWVQKNIRQFGGDPSRVTIFGESAGGISVSFLTGAPAAKGLFQGAISESGGAFAPPMSTVIKSLHASPLRTLRYAESIGEEFLQTLGAADIAAARKISTEDILKAKLSEPSKFFWVVLDGDVLPASNYDLYNAQRFNDTPVLIGTNSDEGAGKVLAEASPTALQDYVMTDSCRPEGQALLSLYLAETPDELTQAVEGVSRDGTYAWNTWTWARLQASKGRGKTYVYHFDLRTPTTPHGAPHFAEVPYVFGNFDGTNGEKTALRPEDQQVSTLMRQYWISFARHGDPNGPGLPVWPTFNNSTEQAMVFDTAPGPRVLPNIERLKAVDRYYACRWDRAHPL